MAEFEAEFVEGLPESIGGHGSGYASEIFELNNTIIQAGVLYRMRATDTTLSKLVYWNTSSVDGDGSEYSGPGPLIGINVFKILGV